MLGGVVQLRFEVYNKYVNSEIILANEKAVRKDIFLIHSEKALEPEEVDVIKTVLHNPVLQNIQVISEDSNLELTSLDVLFLPGMTDNVATSIVSALQLTALANLKISVYTGKTFQFLRTPIFEPVNPDVSNPLLHFCETTFAASSWKFPKRYLQKQDVRVEYATIAIESLKSWVDGRLLALNPDEIQTIYEYFKNDLKRDPTDVEIEIIAQTWSEHCKHKIFAANYVYSELEHQTKKIPVREIKSLFSTYIKSTVKSHHKDCVSVFHDNAGVMRWDTNVDVCIKVETHNSPSALDPFSGAVTGVLGVQRDIMGTGRGAKPIANMDVFCLGRIDDYPTANDNERPQKLLHPETILRGVHKGVEDGGNKMGVPTINGSFQFHPNYAGKPLIYVGSVGVMPRFVGSKECVNKEIEIGDLVYVGGGRLGRDGIHGATFSSLSMEGEIPTSVVQIGDPITQKKLLDFTIKARDLGLIRGLTDNGAGGISSSVGELSQYTNGVTIAIDKHPLKYDGLQCFEMVISESQERMTYAIAPNQAKAFEALAVKMGVEVSCLGEFNDKGYFEITYKNDVIAKLPLEFLHEACPKMNLKAEWQGPEQPKYWFRKQVPLAASNLATEALKLLSSPNICSKEPWVRAYDHEVQGASIGKPFQGLNFAGPSNAGVIDLEMHGGAKNTAIAIGHGFSAKLSCFDTYWMTQMAIDECVRNLVASGGNPKKISLLDNFCWPNPFLETSKHRLGQLVRSVEALKDMADLLDVPFISGKDSMKNSFQGKNALGQTISIDVEPSLLISGMSYVEDHKHLLPSSFVKADQDVYFIGLKPMSLLGSEYSYYFQTKEELKIPMYDFMMAKNIHHTIYELIKNECLTSIHDVSDGGILCAALESMIGNEIGIQLDLELDRLLAFGEAPAGYIVSVNSAQISSFKQISHKIPVLKLGKTLGTFEFKSPNTQIKGKEIMDAWRLPIC
jgi:phosphoribosylformylglycinamidine synthase II